MLLPQPIGSIFVLLRLVALALKVFALIDVAIRRETLFPAAGKLQKPFWLIILGIAVAWNMLADLSIMDIINICGLVAAIVYIVDVRPAVRSLGRGRGQGDGRHMGPYGPW